MSGGESETELTTLPLVSHGTIQPTNSPVSTRVSSALRKTIKVAKITLLHPILNSSRTTHIPKTQRCKVSSDTVRVIRRTIARPQVRLESRKRTSLDAITTRAIRNIPRRIHRQTRLRVREVSRDPSSVSAETVFV